MREAHGPNSREINSSVVFIEQWLALHPGRTAHKLVGLTTNTARSAEVIDINRKARATALLAEVINITERSSNITPPTQRFNNSKVQKLLSALDHYKNKPNHPINQDVWKRPKTD